MQESYTDALAVIVKKRESNSKQNMSRNKKRIEFSNKEITMHHALQAPN